MASEKEFYQKYYGVLEGAKITKVIVKEENDFGMSECWPTFHVMLKDNTMLELEISQDPEGNGPGFIFGLPSVQP